MLKTRTSFDASALRIDYAAEADRIAASIQQTLSRDLKRQGLVLGVSGGIDSSVCAALAVRAVGADRVQAILMPERESSDSSTRRGRLLCDSLGLTPILEDITGPLEALGCYERRDNAIRRMFPDYGPGWKQKIGLATGLLDADRVNYFNMTVQSPSGKMATARMPVDVYLAVVAATNLKQRIRKTVEYTHADARNFAVLGTPNRLEFELGFFVRGGDGLADLKPIAHLYKTQVYEMAAYLGLPDDIQAQAPSTDTYTLPQSQEEFYYAIPYQVLDLALCAFGQGVSPQDAATALGIDSEQVTRVYRDIVQKRRTSARIMRHAALVEPVALEGID